MLPRKILEPGADLRATKFNSQRPIRPVNTSVPEALAQCLPSYKETVPEGHSLALQIRSAGEFLKSSQFLVPKISVARYTFQLEAQMLFLFLSLGLSTQRHKTFHMPKTDPSSPHSQGCSQPSGQHYFGKSKGERAPLFLSLQRRLTVTIDDTKH